jgi:SAM-dependent methyltransferase
MPSLLLGAGHDRRKKVYLDNNEEWAQPLVTLDMGADSKPDVLWDLENRPLPFKDEEFDEMGAFDVLEHVGKAGDWRGWFDEFAEYWRILKPGGTFHIIVPIGGDAFADPGHTRFIGGNWFGFLNQGFYARNIAAKNPVTDYRWYWKHNFEIAFLHKEADHHLATVLIKA